MRLEELLADPHVEVSTVGQRPVQKRPVFEHLKANGKKYVAFAALMSVLSFVQAQDAFEVQNNTTVVQKSSGTTLNVFDVLETTAQQNKPVSFELNIKDYKLGVATERLLMKPLHVVLHPKNAVIFVGGVGNNFDYWDKEWVDAEKADDTLIVGFNDNHKNRKMKKSAEALSDYLSTLEKAGIQNVRIVAHSMGGLVVREALNLTNDKGILKSFQSVDFHAFGTPWGGFNASNFALMTPGMGYFEEKYDIPMAREMAPMSEFMKNLSRPLPENATTTLYHGSKDDTATPEMDGTKARYASIKGSATNFVQVEGAEHDDYVKHKELFNAQRKAFIAVNNQTARFKM